MIRLALVWGALALTSCSAESESELPLAPAPVSFSDLQGADKNSPLKIDGVERRVDAAVGLILASYRGQRLSWDGVVLQQNGQRLVVGVQTLRVVLVLEGELGLEEPGTEVNVTGIVDQIDPESRTVHLMREASAAPLR